MRSHHVGDLVVTDTRSRWQIPVGILTDRDTVVELQAEGIDLNKILAGDALSNELLSVKEQEGLQQGEMVDKFGKTWRRHQDGVWLKCRQCGAIVAECRVGVDLDLDASAGTLCNPLFEKLGGLPLGGVFGNDVTNLIVIGLACSCGAAIKSKVNRSSRRLASRMGAQILGLTKIIHASF